MFIVHSLFCLFDIKMAKPKVDTYKNYSSQPGNSLGVNLRPGRIYVMSREQYRGMFSPDYILTDTCVAPGEAGGYAPAVQGMTLEDDSNMHCIFAPNPRGLNKTRLEVRHWKVFIIHGEDTLRDQIDNENYNDLLKASECDLDTLFTKTRRQFVSPRTYTDIHGNLVEYEGFTPPPIYSTPTQCTETHNPHANTLSTLQKLFDLDTMDDKIVYVTLQNRALVPAMLGCLQILQDSKSNVLISNVPGEVYTVDCKYCFTSMDEMGRTFKHKEIKTWAQAANAFYNSKPEGLYLRTNVLCNMIFSYIYKLSMLYVKNLDDICLILSELGGDGSISDKKNKLSVTKTADDSLVGSEEGRYEIQEKITPLTALVNSTYAKNSLNKVMCNNVKFWVSPEMVLNTVEKRLDEFRPRFGREFSHPKDCISDRVMSDFNKARLVSQALPIAVLHSVQYSSCVDPRSRIATQNQMQKRHYSSQTVKQRTNDARLYVFEKPEDVYDRDDFKRMSFVQKLIFGVGFDKRLFYQSLRILDAGFRENAYPDIRALIADRRRQCAVCSTSRKVSSNSQCGCVLVPSPVFRTADLTDFRLDRRGIPMYTLTTKGFHISADLERPDYSEKSNDDSRYLEWAPPRLLNNLMNNLEENKTLEKLFNTFTRPLTVSGAVTHAISPYCGQTMRAFDKSTFDKAVNALGSVVERTVSRMEEYFNYLIKNPKNSAERKLESQVTYSCSTHSVACMGIMAQHMHECGVNTHCFMEAVNSQAQKISHNIEQKHTIARLCSSIDTTTSTLGEKNNCTGVAQQELSNPIVLTVDGNVITTNLVTLNKLTCFRSKAQVTTPEKKKSNNHTAVGNQEKNIDGGSKLNMKRTYHDENKDVSESQSSSDPEHDDKHQKLKMERKRQKRELVKSLTKKRKAERLRKCEITSDWQTKHDMSEPVGAGIVNVMTKSSVLSIDGTIVKSTPEVIDYMKCCHTIMNSKLSRPVVAVMGLLRNYMWTANFFNINVKSQMTLAELFDSLAIYGFLQESSLPHLLFKIQQIMVAAGPLPNIGFTFTSLLDMVGVIHSARCQTKLPEICSRYKFSQDEKGINEMKLISPRSYNLSSSYHVAQGKWRPLIRNPADSTAAMNEAPLVMNIIRLSYNRYTKKEDNIALPDCTVFCSTDLVSLNNEDMRILLANAGGTIIMGIGNLRIDSFVNHKPLFLCTQSLADYSRKYKENRGEAGTGWATNIVEDPDMQLDTALEKAEDLEGLTVAFIKYRDLTKFKMTREFVAQKISEICPGKINTITALVDKLIYEEHPEVNGKGDVVEMQEELANKDCEMTEEPSSDESADDS